MKVLVTGAGGMLGRDLCDALMGRHTPIPVTRAEADVTDLERLQAVFERERPDTVVHAAAMTDVDASEREADLAFLVNCGGAWAAATAAKRVGARLILLSSDFVFDGESKRPYLETDRPHPLNVYGASKLAAEQLARLAWQCCTIVRTQWLFGRHGRSFPRAILGAAAEGRPLRVVDDQVGCPTYTRHLAEKLVWLCEALAATGAGGTPAVPGSGAGGTPAVPGWRDRLFHIAASGSASRWELAREILRRAGWEDVPVERIRSDEWPTPARRPAFSALASRFPELQGANALPPWQEGVAAFVQELREAGEMPERRG